MWLIIRKADTAVVGTQLGIDPSAYWDSGLFDVKEWAGPEPAIHDPDEDIYSYDPTLTDLDYPTFMEARGIFNDLEAQATTEIAWLEAAIPTIDSADLATLRLVLKRIAQENLREIRAWRYLFRRLG